VKILRNLDEERLMIARQEFDLLKSLRHPHIVRVKEFFVTPKEIYMVMELVKGMELFERIC
jgi:serine/threonine protein kinase